MIDCNKEETMKNLTVIIVIGLLAGSLSGCAVYDRGYYVGGGPVVDLSFWGGGWGGGHGHGWGGGHGHGHRHGGGHGHGRH